MTKWEPDKIIEILINAAKTAFEYYDIAEKEIKDDLSIVTAADKQIEFELASIFENLRDGSYVIGEESLNLKEKSYLKSALENTVWIVDPIDGTVQYANGLPFWGISIGFAVNGVIQEGAVYFPVFKEMFITCGDDVFTAKIDTFSDKNPSLLNFKKLLKTSSCYNEYDIVVLTQKFAKNGIIDIPNPVLVLCCATASFCFTGSGKFMAYVGANIKLWDYAASFAILNKLGFHAVFINGEQMSTEIKKNHLFNNGDMLMPIKGEVVVASEIDIVERLRKKIIN